MQSGQEQKITRWDNQSDQNKAVWRYFDEYVASSIIDAALTNNPVALADLYHALSMARLKCEWVKSMSPATQKEIESLAVSIMPNNFFPEKIGFGAFQYGGTAENNLFDEQIWGVEPVQLSKARVDATLKTQQIALSLISHTETSAELIHPTGPVLDLLQQDFQNLLEANELSKFLQIAARMMHELSNYPPITRGSLAVNSWMINKIFQKNFNTDVNILPPFADWFAFYESPEQYTGYFITSAIAEYLKKLPHIYEKNKTFLDDIWNIMLKDPNNPENLHEREHAWNILKKIAIEEAKDDPVIAQAMNWNFTFVTPLSNGENHNNKTTANIPEESLVITDEYNRFGHASLTEDEIYDIEPISIDMYNKSKLKTALRNGGMTLTYAASLTKEQLKLATSSAAFLLYALNKFIRASHLVSERVDTMQNNILRLIAIHYLNEKIDDIKSEEIRTLLLEPITVELYKKKQINIQPLLSGDINQCRKGLLSLYLNDYFNEKDDTGHIASLSNNDVAICLKRVIALFNQIQAFAEKQRDAEEPNNFFSKRRLSVSALMHLNDTDLKLILAHLSPTKSSFKYSAKDYEQAMKKHHEWLGKLNISAPTSENKPHI